MSKTAVQPVETTNTSGYYNPNTWPIHVSISELNLGVLLKPTEYILDRTGRKVNDPILEKYVGPKMLQAEVTPKKVPVVRIVTTPVPTASAHQHPVGQGVKDAKGKWQPAPPAPPIAQPSASNPSIRGMSVEKARELGLIGRPRLVPEDYGLAETGGSSSNDGGRIPPIKASMESVPRAVKNVGLPKALLDEIDPKFKPLVDSMASAATVADPEGAPDLSKQAAVEAVREQQGEAGVAAFEAEQPEPVQVRPPEPAPAPTKPKAAARVAQVAKPATAAKPVSAAKPGSAARVAAVVKPAMATTPGSPIMGGTPAALPQPDLGPLPIVDVAELAEEEAPLACKCPHCDRSFKFPSRLKRHIASAHVATLQAGLPQPDI